MSDISLCYTKQGAGPPLLLLHGNGEDGSYFTHQTDYFSRRYTDEQGILRAPILGFSDGGNIALTFTLAHPGRVSRLILNGANLDPSGVKAHIQIPIILGYKLASLFAEKSPQAKAHAEMLGLMVNEPRIDPEALQKLRVRTLVIVGTKDMIKDEHTLLIARSLPRSRLEIIAGDHFIAAKNPGAFNRAVDEFLSEP